MIPGVDLSSDQVRHAELGNLLHQFIAVGLRVDVLVVPELGIDPQVGCSPNGSSQIVR